MTDVAFAGKRVVAGLVLFGTILVFAVWDMAYDFQRGVSWLHLAFEFTFFAMGAAGVAVLGTRLLALRSRASQLVTDLEAAKREAERWKAESRELLAGLSDAIDRQFRRWNLTPAEAEVGLLLLKGLSHRDAAGVRGTSERTVRQQALTLYRKAGLAGRTELSAFFLEDLLLPRPSQGS